MGIFGINPSISKVNGGARTGVRILPGPSIGDIPESLTVHSQGDDAEFIMEIAGEVDPVTGDHWGGVPTTQAFDGP
jgi:hypothetical protein